MADSDQVGSKSLRNVVATLWRRIRGERPSAPSNAGVLVIGDGVGAGPGGAAVGGNVYGDIHIRTSPPPTPPEGLRQSYLSWLIDEVRSVPLAGVDQKSISEETRRDLDLAAVYTALLTQRTESSEEHPKHELRVDHERERLSALAVLNAEPRLALLGDPGSGKSTFVNFVALCMAGELLGRSDACLETLRTPVPYDGDEGARREEQPSQPWDHGPLLPLRVILREFVARVLTPGEHAGAARKNLLWQFLIDTLPDLCATFLNPYGLNCSTRAGCYCWTDWTKCQRRTSVASK